MKIISLKIYQVDTEVPSQNLGAVKIETCRYENLPVERRLCFYCTENEVEDEIHVMLKCPLYADLQSILYNHAVSFYGDFYSLSDKEKFIFLFNNENMFYYTAKICYDKILKRKCTLYA